MQNIQRPPRDAVTEPVQEKSSAFGEYEYATELSRQSGSGIRKTNDRVTEQGFDKTWYGAGSGITETVSSQRNNFDIKLGSPNYSAPRSADNDAKSRLTDSLLSSKSSSGIDRSWKNSEEEEYMWDDVNSKSTIHGAKRKSQRDPRLTDDYERLVSLPKGCWSLNF